MQAKIQRDVIATLKRMGRGVQAISPRNDGRPINHLNAAIRDLQDIADPADEATHKHAVQAILLGRVYRV